MKQVKFILPLLLMVACIGNVRSAEVTQVYSTGFESCTAGNSYQSTQTYAADKANGASWTIYYGIVSTSSKITGNNSAHIRLYSNKNAGYLLQTSDISDVDSISFKYAVSNKAVRFDVLYSTDQGSNWTKLESVVPSGTSTVTLQYKLSSRASNFRLKVLVTGGFPSSNNYTFRIDDIYYAKITTATPSTYTLVYDANGGTGTTEGVSNQATATFTLAANGFTAPTGKEFDCWNTKSDGSGVNHTPNASFTAQATGTTTIYAKWRNATYNVTYNLNGGSWNGAEGAANYTYGTGIATLANNVEKTGARFDGWFGNEGLTGSAVTTIATNATGDKKFWAKWTTMRTVTWYVNSVEYSTGSPTTSVADGGKVTTLPTEPTVPDGCSGKVFVGWTTAKIETGTDTAPAVLFKDAANAPTVSGSNASYYAVFADEN